jgi:hypothetical protein
MHNTRMGIRITGPNPDTGLRVLLDAGSHSIEVLSPASVGLVGHDQPVLIMSTLNPLDRLANPAHGEVTHSEPR